MIKRRLHNFTTVLVLLSAPLARAQNPPTRLTFDVATIRLSPALDRNGGIKALPGGDGYTAQNIPVKLMISLMYRVPMRQITGGPDWLETDRYNVEARADHAYSLDDLHIMYQDLLADRFHLKFHKETREGNVYALTLDTSGSKMKLNEGPQDFNIPITYAPDGSAIGKRVPIPYLCWWLGLQLQSTKRPVIDLTGLTGNYDFTLTFAPELPPDATRDNQSPEQRDRPTLFEALKQQLGLKLQSQKGPVDYYVIDHVDRPTDN